MEARALFNTKKRRERRTRRSVWRQEPLLTRRNARVILFKRVKITTKFDLQNELEKYALLDDLTKRNGLLQRLVGGLLELYLIRKSRNISVMISSQLQVTSLVTSETSKYHTFVLKGGLASTHSFVFFAPFVSSC
jgi:hypothetical protein